LFTLDVEAMLAAEVRTDLVIRNPPASIACVLVALAIVALSRATIIIHWALLFGRAPFALIALLVALLSLPLLLFVGSIGLRLFSVILAPHVRIVIATAVVGSRRLVFPFTLVVIFGPLLILLIGSIFVTILRVARSGRNQEQE
jgi:hypothetical protein